MISFANKCSEVASHFRNGDTSIGFRKLVDCVLDTQDSFYYKKCIELTEWKEANPDELAILSSKAIDLLDELKGLEIQENTTNTVLLEATNLSKQYNQGRFKLGDITMSIKPGDIWGLVGENGNGKTTLLRILAKDLSFDRGSLQINLPFETADDYTLRSYLTYIPQRTPKWYGSLKSNLKYAASHYGIHGEENELLVLMYIIRFGLWNYRNHQWSELSSGYKMRFELARTFLRKPKILLLDEPLANLDVLAQQLILEDLKNLSQSISNPLGIVLSSQQLFEVEKVSDKILFLKNGAPIHLAEANEESKELMTILEIDMEIDRSLLSEVLSHLPVHEINFNGGMYLISINQKDATHEVLNALIRSESKIKYFRDISQSTRRLFV